MATKKTNATSKKPATKKKTSSSAAKTPTKKSAPAKNPVTKKTSPAKKPSTSKKTKSSSKTTTKNFVATRTEILINNKKVKLTKRVKLESYSCVWRMYVILDPKTNQQITKRFWIVIGYGHKRYRKFETQFEAISYFRSLKKYAKMRVQSVKSKDFIRTVLTFFEMAWRGIDIEGVKSTSKPKSRRKQDLFVEEDDFFDEYSQFENEDNEMEEDGEKEEISQEEIDKILLESDTDSIVVLDEEEPTEEPIVEEVKEETSEDSFVTEIIEPIETQEPEEYDPYAVTTEVVFEEEPVEEPIVEEEKTTLFELAEKKPVDEEYAILNDEEISTEEEFDITQHQTALNSVSPEEEIIEEGKYSKYSKVIYWLIVTAISLTLVLIVVLAMLLTAGVI